MNTSCKAMMKHALLGVANFVFFDICSNHTISQGTLSSIKIIMWDNSFLLAHK